ncbi:hypothetical protein ANRL2_00529 [Anaerolineae bacterium]|nr:hypothetical protein ANRL2_00529 [Anaerolineae bacterium]
MTILVAGATGATGRLLAGQLLDRGDTVKMVVRDPGRLPDAVKNHPRAVVMTGTILDLGDHELVELVRGCDAVALCLGHNLSMRGIFGHPRRLVADTTRRLCQAIRETRPARPVRFVLMNTVANSNRDIPESRTVAERCVIGLIRALVPPQPDNEEAAEYLRTAVGKDDASISWVVVRPDSLTDEMAVTEYDVHPSPVRSGVFDPGKTSRINVGHFMAAVIGENALWDRWKGQMPVIYNRQPA